MYLLLLQLLHLDQWANQFSRALERMVLIQAVFTIDAVLIVIVIVVAFVAVNMKNDRTNQPKIIQKSSKKSIKIDQKSINNRSKIDQTIDQKSD